MTGARKKIVGANHVFRGQKELAEYLSVTQGAVAKWTTDGMPAVLSSPGRYHFSWGSVRDWLKLNRPYMRAWIDERGL